LFEYHNEVEGYQGTLSRDNTKQKENEQQITKSRKLGMELAG